MPKDRGYIIRNEKTGSYIICIPKDMDDPYPLFYSHSTETHNFAGVMDARTAIIGLQCIRDHNASK
jgi:hypothetical protein